MKKEIRQLMFSTVRYTIVTLLSSYIIRTTTSKLALFLNLVVCVLSLISVTFSIRSAVFTLKNQ